MNLRETVITHNGVSFLNRFSTCLATQSPWDIYSAKETDNRFEFELFQIMLNPIQLSAILIKNLKGL